MFNCECGRAECDNTICIIAWPAADDLLPQLDITVGKGSVVLSVEKAKELIFLLEDKIKLID